MVTRQQPIVFTWREVDVTAPDGEVTRQMAMVPTMRYANVAKRQFGDADTEHVLEQANERSMASHSQFFAAIKDYFDNIPEKMQARWPTPEHFRKWLLVECGWFDEKEFDMISEKHAKGLGTFIRTEDEYARITISGKKVIVRRAKSQSLKAMGKDDFQRSKQDVLELAEQFVGVPRAVAMKNAGRSA
jgi:hypothetical protein